MQIAFFPRESTKFESQDNELMVSSHLINVFNSRAVVFNYPVCMLRTVVNYIPEYSTRIYLRLLFWVPFLKWENRTLIEWICWSSVRHLWPNVSGTVDCMGSLKCTIPSRSCLGFYSNVENTNVRACWITVSDSIESLKAHLQIL